MKTIAPGPERPPRRVPRLVMLATGWLLIVLTPFVGVIPGPGGVFVFAAGLSLILRSSRWAQRRYVRFKRWWPRAGTWCDWGLRRQSHRRRQALARAAD